MGKRINSILIFICLIFLSFPIYSLDDCLTKLKSDIAETKLSVYGGSTDNDINFIILGTNTGKNYISKVNSRETVYMIILDNDYRAVNYYKGTRTTNVFPIDYTDKYIAFGLSPYGESGRWIIVYDVKEDNFTEYKINFAWFWDICIHRDELFFTSDSGFAHLNVINLKSKQIRNFYDLYFPSCKFGIYNDEVYATWNERLFLYKWNGNNFVEDRTVQKDDLKIRDKYLKDFILKDDSLLYKLGLFESENNDICNFVVDSVEK